MCHRVRFGLKRILRKEIWNWSICFHQQLQNSPCILIFCDVWHCPAEPRNQEGHPLRGETEVHAGGERLCGDCGNHEALVSETCSNRLIIDPRTMVSCLGSILPKGYALTTVQFYCIFAVCLCNKSSWGTKVFAHWAPNNAKVAYFCTYWFLVTSTGKSDILLDNILQDWKCHIWPDFDVLLCLIDLLRLYRKNFKSNSRGLTCC